MTDMEHAEIDLYKEPPSPSIGEGQGVGIDLAFDAAAWVWDILHDDDGANRRHKNNGAGEITRPTKPML